MMSWLWEGWRRIASLTTRGAIERRLDMELRFHVEQQTEKNRRAGVSLVEAQRQALIKFGGIDLAKERTRDQFRVSFLEDSWRDLRYCGRALLSAPGFLLTSTLTLALGIGANTAVFTVFNSVLLKPLAYPHSDELVAVWNRAPGAPSFADVSDGLRLSLSMYVTYAEQNRTFARFGVWGTGTGAVTGLREPEQVRTVFVTDGTLQTFAIPPRLGRWLSEQDQRPGTAATAMLTYGYWQRRFGGEPEAVGQIITIDNIPRQIVGVMPHNFKFPNADTDVILPVLVDRSRLIRPGFAFFGVARLKPDATIAEANADVARMLPAWLQGWPGGGTQFYESMRITPALRPLKDDVIGNTKAALWVVMGTIAIVLLIACANVTNLLLVRAEGRQSEVAVRAALGAGSWRLTRQRLLESVLLSVSGGLFGLGVAYAGLRLLAAIGPTGLPRLDEISLDRNVLVFTFALSLVAGVLLGLAPALKSSGHRIGATLHGGTRIVGSRQHHRTLKALVLAQVALAVVLLIASGLMIRTFQALRSVDPGFTDPEQLQVMRITVPPLLIAEREKVLRLQNDLVDKLSAIPGVRSASLISSMPIEGIPTNWDAISVEDKPTVAGETPPLRPFKYVWPGLFRTIGTRLLAGRDFTWNDIYAVRPVVMISARLAREVWGTAASAVGRRIRQGGPNSQWREIVGVVDDVRENGVDAPAPAIVYWPPLLESTVPGVNVVRTATFVLRSSAAGTELFQKQIQEAVWSVNGNLPVASTQTMQDVYQRSLSKTTFTLIMLAIAGGMALVLGFIGIYGVIAYTVAQRRREIGIRLALGAQRAELRRRFVSDGLILSGAGLAIGVALSTIVTRLMTSLLFNISPLDPSTYVGVVLLVTGAAVGASYLPARRASRLEPRVAMHEGY